MFRSQIVGATVAVLVLGGASAVHADNRSSNAIAADTKTHTNNGKNVENPVFPDNRGLERAREVANEHARFKRHDSEG